MDTIKYKGFVYRKVAQNDALEALKTEKTKLLKDKQKVKKDDTAALNGIRKKLNALNQRIGDAANKSVKTPKSQAYSYSKKKKSASTEETPTFIKHKGNLYKKAEDDKEIEDAVAQLGKVRELIKGALGLIREKKFEEAEKLLQEQINDLEKAKQDVSEELPA